MTPPDDGQPGDLARLLRVQASLVELIGAALLLGFGINLLATAVSDHVSLGSGVALGVIASLAGIALLIFQGLGARARRRTIRGFCTTRQTRVLSPRVASTASAHGSRSISKPPAARSRSSPNFGPQGERSA